VDYSRGLGHDQYNSDPRKINKLVDLVVIRIILSQRIELSKLVDKTRGLGHDQYNSDPRE